MTGKIEEIYGRHLTHINYPDDNFGEILLSSGFVAYHDDDYGVTSNEHKIIFKVTRNEDTCAVFYFHVPYAYPIPDGVRDNVTKALKGFLKLDNLKIKFINAATEFEKKDLKFRVNIGG